MRIYIDADAFPNALRSIVFRAADRVQVPFVFVACQPMRLPTSPNVIFELVANAPDAADDWIADAAQVGDLVVTADLPLADRVIEKGACALDPRGECYSHDNIKERLAARDLMESLRDRGLIDGGPPAFNAKNAQVFANRLNQFLQKAAMS